MAETFEIWNGEAHLYDDSRPTTPVVLLDMLSQLIHMPRPSLVVDLGCGTGLSTTIWGERAERVIGIEPNEDMRARALKNNQHHPYRAHITYQEGLANQTGLAADSADIVTCSQAFHWMEPVSTLAEISRILRPGGVFVAYDYDWPPLISWELEQVYAAVDQNFEELDKQKGFSQSLQRWPKTEHITRMTESGHFRFTRQLQVHSIEQGDATRFINLVMTNTYSHHFKLQNITEQEIGFDRLREAARTCIGSQTTPWYFSYNVCLGIK